jgi:hypothetical protein
MAYLIRYAQRRHLILMLAAVTLSCAGTVPSSRSSGGEQERDIIVSSSVTPIRTDSLEYTPRGTPPLRYIVIRATFTNFSNDTAHVGWCRAPTLLRYALEEYSAGTWSKRSGLYGLTCLDEQVPPLVLAPNESHTALIELGWFTGLPPGRHLDYLKLSGRTLRIVYAEVYRGASMAGERPEPDAKLPPELRVSNAFRVLGDKAP